MRPTSVRKPFSLIRERSACLEFNCKNRNIKCDVCVRKSELVKPEKK